MTGAEMVAAALQAEGVEVVFGYPGGTVLPIYDALFRYNVRHVLVRHEQGAAHAAEGYAQSTGKVGVCIATSGPGATNLVTGIADAFLDSVPLVAITGNVARASMGTDAFQEADITGITTPITKHNFLVRDVHDLPRILKAAFHIAATGRPGPVLIDIPKDVQNSVDDFTYPDSVHLEGYNPNLRPHMQQLIKLAALIKASNRPLLYVGGGAIRAQTSEAVRTLAEKLHAPVVMTLKGLGAFPESHPLSLGMLGMHGSYAANHAVLECDLLLALGARFDDRVTGEVASFAPNATIAQIDVDPAEIGKNKPVDLPIVADLKRAIEALLPLVEEGNLLPQRQAWVDRCRHFAERFPFAYDRTATILKPQAVIETLHRLTHGNAFVVTDVGQHQMWAAQFYPVDAPHQFITSGGLGTMGFGLPAAIGVQIAHPKAQVILITGDASLQMTMQELATVAQYDLPIKVVIINNGFLGMVRQWQELFYEKRYAHSEVVSIPDFVKLAEAFRIHGARVDSMDGLDASIEHALAIPGPAVIDAIVDPQENVLPMVPPGAPLSAMIGWWSKEEEEQEQQREAALYGGRLT
ncbi:MAG: biosynthetic-type acetolactate synthase large subunit [Firmicutes bacterium]|nr:biosynthetic-type acetolactate synthase large subunit [Bacillota bacterium]